MSTDISETDDAYVLRHDRDDGVTMLTFNRPDRFNVLSEAMLAALREALDAVAESPGVRVVVIAGRGRAFCAGHDLKEMRAQPDRGYYRWLFAECSRMMLAIRDMPQPVIARVHGAAAAAGCQLVAACDLAVASTEAIFGTTGIRYGLFCSTPGVALSRNVPRKKAFEMLVTGDTIDAATARELGLVNRAVTPAVLDAEIDRLATAILARPRGAVASGKRLFHRQAELGLEDAYALAIENMACDMLSDEACEGIDAFLEKRSPDWRR